VPPPFVACTHDDLSFDKNLTSSLVSSYYYSFKDELNVIPCFSTTFIQVPKLSWYHSIQGILQALDVY
jgi:hypothetical protein